MRTHAQMLLGGALALLVSATAWGHVGVEYFYPQVPDPAAMVMDGKDDDWGWLDQGEFAITTEQMFGQQGEEISRDDIDVAFWMAWSAPPDNRLYFYAVVTDDTLKLLESDQKRWWSDDIIQITFDADHSGGDFLGENLDHVLNGQRYHLRINPGPGQPVAYNSQLEYIDLPEIGWSSDVFNGEPTPWFEVGWTLLPSGAGHGSTNVTWTMEFRCALWDSYATTPEESVRHVFEENQVIHIGPKFNDREPVASDEASPFRHNLLPLGSAAAQDQKGDQMPDWIGLGTDEPTSVADNSWGRIKSHLQGQLD